MMNDIKLPSDTNEDPLSNLRITPNQMADISGVSVHIIYRLVEQNKIPFDRQDPDNPKSHITLRLGDKQRVISAAPQTKPRGNVSKTIRIQVADHEDRISALEQQLHELIGD